MVVYAPDTRFVRTSTMFRKQSEGGLVFNHRKREIVRLNSTGYFLWEMIDGVNTVSEMINILARETGRDEDFIAGDVEKYLAFLEQMKLIEQCDEEVAPADG